MWHVNTSPKIFQSFLGVEAVQGLFLSLPLLSPFPIPPRHFHFYSGRLLNLPINAERLSIYHLHWHLCLPLVPFISPSEKHFAISLTWNAEQPWIVIIIHFFLFNMGMASFSGNLPFMAIKKIAIGVHALCDPTYTYVKVRKNGLRKTCNLSCNIAAEQVE